MKLHPLLQLCIKARTWIHIQHILGRWIWTPHVTTSYKNHSNYKSTSNKCPTMRTWAHVVYCWHRPVCVYIVHTDIIILVTMFDTNWTQIGKLSTLFRLDWALKQRHVVDINTKYNKIKPKLSSSSSYFLTIVHFKLTFYGVLKTMFAFRYLYSISSRHSIIIILNRVFLSLLHFVSEKEL